MPITNVTQLYLNLLLVVLSEEYGYFFVDTDNNNAPCGLDKFRRSRGGHLHARIVEIQQKFYVEDLGSQYGTWVNDALVGEYRLAPWDTIRVGIYTLVFNFESEPIVREVS